MIQFTFDLYPEDGKLGERIPYGYKFRGVIMKWLLDSNPDLGEEFHNPEEIRPYAINTIPRRRENKIEFILTSYNEELSDTVIHDVLQGEKAKLTVDRQKFLIARITFDRPNLEQIRQQTAPITKFQIQFVTPVYFNTLLGNYPVRFPMPDVLFGNLVHLWNDITGEGLQIERDSFLRWVGAHLYISGYKMRTAKRDIGKRKPIVGGLGNATYRVTKLNTNYYKHLLEEMEARVMKDKAEGKEKVGDMENADGMDERAFVKEDFSEKCRWLHVLCQLGTYTNVGGNRTAGMGVIRYWVKEKLTGADLLNSRPI